MKKKITERALYQRINRALAKESYSLCKNRSPENELGRFYTVNNQTGNLDAWRINDLEEWARREMKGVIKDWEVLEDD